MEFPEGCASQLTKLSATKALDKTLFEEGSRR
jgi:hypothetical protein